MGVARAASHERELKLGIPDDATFDALLEAAGGERAAPSVQENYFFDAPDLALSARGVALRIRCEDARWTVTLKGLARPNAGALLADRVEVECALEPDQASAALDGRDPTPVLIAALAPRARGPEACALLDALRETCARAPLERLGGFRNRRTRVRTALAAGGARIPVVLEFDRTEFAPGEIRREVELELSPGDPEAPLRGALLALFEKVGAEALPVDSKLAHFLALRGPSRDRSGAPSPRSGR